MTLDPVTLEQAIAERNAWCETAKRHLRNERYYRDQRDAFLREALGNQVIADAAQRVVGPEWQKLVEDDHA